MPNISFRSREDYRKMIKYIFTLLLSWIMLVNFTIASNPTSPIKWRDSLPSLKFKVSASDTGFISQTKVDQVRTIKEAAKNWSVIDTEKQLSYIFEGLTANENVDQLNGTVECSMEFVNELEKVGNHLVYSPDDVDICTGDACSFVWSCVDTNSNLGFLTIVNANNFNFQSNDKLFRKTYDLRRVVERQFGHIVGLVNCEQGSDCSSFSVGGIPPDESPMASAIRPEQVSNGLTNDDISGLSHLYGNATDTLRSMKSTKVNFKNWVEGICNPSPCVIPELESDGRYRPSSNEIAAENAYNAHLTSIGETSELNDIKTQKHSQALYLDTWTVAEDAPENIQIQMYQSAISKIGLFSNEDLNLYRNQAYSQILGYHNFLLKHKEEIGLEYEEFLRLEMQVIIQIRREIINRL